MLGELQLFQDLQQSTRTAKWAAQLEHCVKTNLYDANNGHLERWLAAYRELPEIEVQDISLLDEAVTCKAEPLSQEVSATLRDCLMRLSPWRKGPFQIFDVFINTEWRSNLKWERLSPHLNLAGKDILDVGCGNGYYGWRMLGAGAKRVVGLDPNLLFVMQFAAIRRYLGNLPLFVLPAGDTILPENLRCFNTVFSMGVLYHRKSPIEHLLSLYQALSPGGELVLETLVIEGKEGEVLIPKDRYAQMNNVWFLPSLSLLERMVERCGFKDIKLIDVSRTNTEEQRGTEWMKFDSLDKFLDPQDSSLTIEGYSAPLRATFTARRL